MPLATFSPWPRLSWTTPVSYTHLDVYKRQGQVGPVIFGRDEQAAGVPVNPVDDPRPKLAIDAGQALAAVKEQRVDHSSGRPAVTHWTVLARYPGYTHVQCRLETGRTHQIRVHMAAQGHPVLGDPVYNGLRKGFPELAGQCLHARRLSFQHPRTGERMRCV